MLTVHVPATEMFDDATQKFFTIEEVTLVLEHSLVSLSKWEEIWEKPFLGRSDLTEIETLSYVKCMTLSPENVSDRVYSAIPNDELRRISDYINKSATATWFSEGPPGRPKPKSKEVITSEVIYYWLIAHRIDFQVQYWHLNRLLTLVKVANIKSDPKKSLMPKHELLAQQRLLNEQRRQKLHSKG